MEMKKVGTEVGKVGTEVGKTVKKNPHLWIIGGVGLVGIVFLISRKPAPDTAVWSYPEEMGIGGGGIGAPVDLTGIHEEMAKLGELHALGAEERDLMREETGRMLQEMDVRHQEEMGFLQEELVEQQKVIQLEEEKIKWGQEIIHVAGPAAEFFGQQQRQPRQEKREDVIARQMERWERADPTWKHIIEQESARVGAPLPVAPTPKPKADPGKARRIREDIAKVEARRGTEHERYFERKYGGIDAYLASQKARLEAIS